ncbi:hypothetical protein ACHQM5_006052 [Ranunculus cassubicifolius]
MASPSISSASAHPILKAAFQGNLDRLKNLVEKLGDKTRDIAKTIAEIKDPHGFSAIHMCTMNGKLGICKYLIDELKVDINLKESNAGHTPINCAVRGGFYKIAVYLLEKGANPDIPSDTGCTALHWAAEKEDVKLLHLLLSSGVNVDALSNDGTALRWAAARGNHRAIKLLLNRQANANITYRQSSTPLLVSVVKNSLRCVELLLEGGAEPDLPGLGMLPLMYAAENGQADMVLSLLKAGANPNVTNQEGLSPIEVAAVERYKDVVEILLPVTSPISSYLDWSVTGIMKHVHSQDAKVQRELKQEETFEEAKFKGDAAFREKDYMMAATCYSRAIAGDPSNAVLLSNRSVCWQRLFHGELALEDAMACIRLKPDWPKAYYRAGSSLSLLMKFDEASKMFSKALDLDPNNAEILKALQDSVAEGLKRENFK